MSRRINRLFHLTVCIEIINFAGCFNIYNPTMKNNFLLLLFLASALGVNGQNSNAVFFSENGERFFVIINGLRQNQSPETNVKITGLNPTTYKVKIIFNDKSLGAVDKNIYLEDYKEYSYVIKKKSESEIAKSSKKIGKALEKNFLGNPSDTVVVEDKPDWYVIRPNSVFDLPRPQYSGSSAGNYSPAQTTTTTTQTSTTVVNPPAGGTQFSMSVNLGGAGGNVGMNVSASDGFYQESTTTTTVTTSGSTGAHYEMPGYSGPVGCPWPMSEPDFQKAKQTISSKSFDDSKLTIARQIINSNCLFSKQVKEIMVLFSFEDTRLDLAKYAYGYTFDKGNYFCVNDAFDFESSIDELNSYINGR